MMKIWKQQSMMTFVLMMSIMVAASAGPDCCTSCSDACLKKYKDAAESGSIFVKDTASLEAECKIEEAGCTDERCGADGLCLVPAPGRECCAACKLVFFQCTSDCLKNHPEDSVNQLYCMRICNRNDLTTCLSGCQACARDPDQGFNGCDQTCDTTTRISGYVHSDDIRDHYSAECRNEC